jgi:type I restriction enzyme S subunit
MARSNEFRDNAVKSMSGATGRQRVQEECFDKFLIAQPDEERLRRFQDITKPMFELVHTLAVRNNNLRRTRDLLLPKLISGEIAV